ncbi:hypothetical protein P170DRAFT_438155 [Aspergillus steynii IBT 23096]|uniref:Uncharacterized protein n=1 Tax=Aspergillus steynii IBT 23096 TaxID=1392250 RepID=A0A2I2G0C3_9EURO|nr:uncharacterized protein P170DRAFT_438155 [Aspergillus steynii IBT 23096]PLB46324.1 hypothetical protein P170DRAFT_438155 [Aspergillus steynii IBT 23096]
MYTASLDTIFNNGTFEFVAKADTKGSKILFGKWVFDIKKDKNGIILRFKAR